MRREILLLAGLDEGSLTVIAGPYFAEGVMATAIARESDTVVPGTAATLAEDIAAGRLVAYDFDAPGMRIDGTAFYLRGRALAPAARAFVEVLHAVAKAKVTEAEATMAAAVRPATTTRRRAGTRR